VYAKDYKDVGHEVEKAVKDFDNQKVLDKFINKYGSGYFRPTATVTREDLLLALHEYNKLNQTLTQYQKLLLKKIVTLKTQLNKIQRTEKNKSGENTVKNDNMDIIMGEVRKNLPLLMATMPHHKQTVKELTFIKDQLTLLENPSSGINEKKISKIIQKSPKLKKLIRKEIKLSLTDNQYSKTSLQSKKDSKKRTNKPDEENKTLTKISIGLSLIAMLFMAR
ncbi:hypothetical protein KAI68_03690, partial [bacterium]|nr:hypothetical protein [bacterium]